MNNASSNPPTASAAGTLTSDPDVIAPCEAPWVSCSTAGRRWLRYCSSVMRLRSRMNGHTSPTSSVSSCASASTMPEVATLSWSSSSAASYWRAAAHCNTALSPAAIPRLRPAPCTCTAPSYRLESSRTACAFPEPLSKTNTSSTCGVMASRLACSRAMSGLNVTIPAQRFIHSPSLCNMPDLSAVASI